MHLGKLLCLLFLWFTTFPALSLGKIDLVTDPWPPYIAPELDQQGFITEITRQAFKRAGLELKTSFLPWKRAIEHGKAGVYQGVLGAFYNDERPLFFYFSDSIGSSEIVLFKRKDRDIPFTKLSDLDGLSIGVINGYFYYQEFEDAENVLKVSAHSHQKNLERLLKGRVDLIIADKMVGSYMLNRHFPERANEIEPLIPSLATEDIYILFPKALPDSKAARDAFNLGLEQIKQDGAYDRIMLYHGY